MTAITIQAAVRRANKAVFTNSKAAVVTKALELLGVAHEAAHNFSCAIFDSKKSATALVKRFFEAQAEKAAAAEAARVAAEAARVSVASKVPSLTTEEYLSKKGKLAEKCGGQFWGVEKKNAPGFDKSRYYFNCVSYPAPEGARRGGMVDIYWDQEQDKMCLKNGGSGPELDAAVAVINEKVKKIVKSDAFARWCFK